MATVNGAFDAFLKDTVNLDPDDTQDARGSRDWLVEQINALPTKHSGFPPLYEDIHIHYGSFARRTKIRELDDLDMIIGLKGLGTTYFDLGDMVQLTAPDGIALRNFCHENSPLLNSRRVINFLVKKLSDVPQYAKSEIKRNGSAAVLNLTSYTWSFDIVPGFITSPDAYGRTYYIIPNGEGHWMKTDPRIDQDRVSRINQAHDGHVLPPLRLMKYWNRRPTMPTMPSYLLECMILDYYENANLKASPYPDVEFAGLLSHIAAAVFTSIQDPKNIQGNINTLSFSDRFDIYVRGNEDAKRAQPAMALERAGNHKAAINKWKDIFGPNFSN